MRRNTRFLLMLCVAAVAGLLALQFWWISNYYQVNKTTFEKEVNLAMEDAMNKEFIVRCDTIEKLVIKQLTDTNEYKISSWYSKTHKTYMLTIFNRRQPSDSSSLHSDSVNYALHAGDTTSRNKIARYIAHSIRENELQNRIVYYHTQRLGTFVADASFKRFDFDTDRLRPILKRVLMERGIGSPFKFYLRSKDSTFNFSRFNSTLQKQYPVISRAFVTNKASKTDHYVRAMFSDPSAYIWHQMRLLFAASVLLIVIVAFSLFSLFRSLLTEKKLSPIKNDFINNITHEFKTPIAAVSAAVEALSEFDVLEDRQKTKRYLNHSKNELQRLTSLVDRVLNISLYEIRQFDIKPVPLDIDQVIPEMLAAFQSAAVKKVEFSYINNTGNKFIQADHAYFEHALGNVIDNAIKYSGDRVVIRVRCEIQDGFFVIMIADNGIGMATKDTGMVFEKFYRAAQLGHKVKGHGLGLSYVKSIVERHLGWCKIDSAPGAGTTFAMAWPI